MTRKSSSPSCSRTSSPPLAEKRMRMKVLAASTMGMPRISSENLILPRPPIRSLRIALNAWRFERIVIRYSSGFGGGESSRSEVEIVLSSLSWTTISSRMRGERVEELVDGR